MTDPALTDRQLEVAALVAQGKSSKSIGHSLGISSNTVNAHVQAICRALGRDENTRPRDFVARWWRSGGLEQGCTAYFVKADGFHGKGYGLILIGCAPDPASRLKELQAASPVRLRLLGTAPGGAKLVESMQARYWNDRAHGDWLEPSDGLLDEIERLVGGSQESAA